MLGLFIALFLETVLTLITTPVNNPICKGQLDSGPGGMFGYSLSLSSGTGPYTWMV